MTEPWRYACPEGHVSITNNVGRKPGSNGENKWYCQNCSRGYNRIKDKKTGEWLEA
jgi:hypothetical protein